MKTKKTETKSDLLTFNSDDEIFDFEKLYQLIDPEETLTDGTVSCKEWEAFYAFDMDTIEKYVSRQLRGFEKLSFEEKIKENAPLRMVVRNAIKSYDENMMEVMIEDGDEDERIDEGKPPITGKLIEMFPE